MVAGTLEVQMLMNLANLARDMNQAKTMVRGAMTDISSAVDDAKKMLASLGVGLSVGYFANLIKGSIDAADHLRDLSKTTDITVENLSGLRLASKQSGGDLESIAASINKLSQNMGKDADKFKALGVTAKEPLEAFKQLSDVFVGIQDPQLRAAVAAQALGKAWAGAAPLLSEGSARIGEMVDKGARLSGVTQEMSDQADELNDKWQELVGTGGLLNRMVAPLLPLLLAMTDDMLEAREKSDGLNGSFNILLESMRVLIVLGGNFAYVWRTIGIAIAGVAVQAEGFATGGLKGFREARAMMTEILEDERRQFDAWEKRMMEAGKVARPESGHETPPIDREDMSGRANEFLKGEKEAKLAAAELLKYENALKALTDELGNLNNQTKEEKVVNDLAMGSLKGLTEAHGQQLLVVAREIDLKKQAEAMSKSQIASIEAQITAQDALNAGITAFQRNNKTTLIDLEFETSMVGKLDLAREQAIATRKVEIEFQQQSGAIAGDETLNTEQRATALANLTKIRNAAVKSITAELATKKDAEVLNVRNLEQMQFELSLIEMTTAQRETAIAVRQLELTGIDQTTDAYKNYVAQLKDVIAAKTAADEMKQAQVSMWQEVDRVGRETFASIFDSGKERARPSAGHVEKRSLCVALSTDAAPDPDQHRSERIGPGCRAVRIRADARRRCRWLTE
jgi:hypothetical protein